MGISFGGLIGTLLIGLMIFGAVTPETSVYLGSQVPKKYIKEIRNLGLLEEKEKIAYFYTDALFDIKDGFYFVSDRHLVLYSQEWEEPQIIINFNDITSMDVEYNDSFLEDSYVTIETASGFEFFFPVSSEQNRDKKFVKYIQLQMDSVQDQAQKVDVPQPK